MMQTVFEFAASIGRTKATVDAWIYKHGMPVVRVGRRVYVRQEDYDSWIGSLVQVGNYKTHVEFVEVDKPRRVSSKIESKIQKIY